jgi:hydrogenase maturation protein HypF
VGLCSRNRFEAEAPLALERAASAAHSPARDPLFAIRRGAVERIDVGPLVMRLADDRLNGGPVAELAALFHEQFAWALAEAALRAVERTGVRIAVLSGGVFCNERLTNSLSARLSAARVQVLRHERVPPNDGGLALGQAAIATARIASGI